jgi:hypothetical protein
MKKHLIKNLLPLSFLAFFIWGCSGIPKDKVAAALKNNEACLQNCNQQEAICWNQYQRCASAAREVWDSEIDECIAGPAVGRGECLRLARAEYISALQTCETNYNNCMADLRLCRSKCNVALSDELPSK